MPEPLVNIHTNTFDVALSFPGESRDYIEKVAAKLNRDLGPYRVFYDNYFKSQLAMPNLDTKLQDLYGNRSRLIVVFLSKHYQEKKWCGIEFRAIRSILNARKDEQIMLVRNDSSDVEGIFDHDGYIDAETHSAEEVADFIIERVQLLDPMFETTWEFRGKNDQKINTLRFLKNGKVECEDFEEAFWRRLDERSILFGYGIESSFLVLRAKHLGDSRMSGFHFKGVARHIVKVDTTRT